MKKAFTPEELELLDAAALAVLPQVYEAALQGHSEMLTHIEMEAIGFQAYAMAEALIGCRRNILSNDSTPHQAAPHSGVIAAIQTSVGERTPSSVPSVIGMAPNGPGAPLTKDSSLRALLAVLPDYHYLMRAAGLLISAHHKVDAMGVTPATLETVTIADFLALTLEDVKQLGAPSLKMMEAVGNTLRAHRIEIPSDSLWATWP